MEPKLPEKRTRYIIEPCTKMPNAFAKWTTQYADDAILHAKSLLLLHHGLTPMHILIVREDFYCEQLVVEHAYTLSEVLEARKNGQDYPYGFVR
jgi:hypothetical protein